MKIISNHPLNHPLNHQDKENIIIMIINKIIIIIKIIC